MKTKLASILGSFEKGFHCGLKSLQQDKTVTAGFCTYTRLTYSSGLPAEQSQGLKRGGTVLTMTLSASST